VVAAGRSAELPGDPLNVPPVLASNFVLGGEYSYTRDDGTATWRAFEEVLGGLEQGVAVAFASGMAAVAAVFDLLPAGAEVVLPDDCYQAVVGLAAAGQEHGRWAFTRLAPDDTDGWLAATAHADLLWLESPSNPLLHVADLPAILSRARKAGALAVIDNTFATPLGQQPLELGAAIVVHSATKYLGGHSDLMLGAASHATTASQQDSASSAYSAAESRARSRHSSPCAACARCTSASNAQPRTRTISPFGSKAIPTSASSATPDSPRTRRIRSRGASCGATAR
jgi:cystathionine beta-lyase/cystathionine gamma-synthase